MSEILILFAHPSLEKSKINKELIRNIPNDSRLVFHDLYEIYPDFNIDIEEEKKLLLKADVIIWHHPFYWYSCPPLLKQWIDLVLEFGWAYGPGGNALKGKIIFNAITTGGAREVYSHEGRNRFTIQEFLAPFDQTAKLCQMTYLPPFAVQGTHKLDQANLEIKGKSYNKLLNCILTSEFKADEMKSFSSLNDWIESFEQLKTENK